MMAGVPPVRLHPTEWTLLRNVSYDRFRDFLTHAEDLGVHEALCRLRADFPAEFRPVRAGRPASNGG